MSRVANISRNIGQSWLAGVWFFLIAYFAVHAFQGDSSLAALKAMSAQQTKLEAQARTTANQRQILESLVAKMSGTEIDPDLLEELVREKLGFSHPDEVIVLLSYQDY